MALEKVQAFRIVSFSNVRIQKQLGTVSVPARLTVPVSVPVSVPARLPVPVRRECFTGSLFLLRRLRRGLITY